MNTNPADTFLKHGEIMADLARSFIRGSILTKPKIEYKIDGDKLVRTSTPPIQLALDEKSRNWEGLARLEDKGFLMIVDEHPRTILAFIPKL